MAETETPYRPVRIAFRIGYLGEGFFGSQFQPRHRTVEGEIRNACIRAGLFSGSPDGRLAISGRTDRGVHARCQVLAFSTPLPDRAIRAFPGQLPPDIWATHYCLVPDSYSPRRDVISRTYRYIFTDQPGDLSLMEDSARLFPGRHDFSGFSKVEAGKTPMRTVSRLEVHADGGCWWLEITAQSYLWHMVRGIATVLLRASYGQQTQEEIAAMLEGPCRNRVKPAPPEGLILWQIDDDLAWNPVPVMPRTVRLHQEKEAGHLTMARVHRLLSP